LLQYNAENTPLLLRITGLFRENDSRPDRNDRKARSIPREDNNLDFHLSLRLRDSTAFTDVHETKSRKVSAVRRIAG